MAQEIISIFCILILLKRDIEIIKLKSGRNTDRKYTES
tara:strand:+ start:319 stop:432 length:114 start_codon:yes stop_codon:yes gene_type:complete